jgi:hypothetical protein
MMPLFSPKPDPAMHALKSLAITILVVVVCSGTLALVDFGYMDARFGRLGAALAGASCHSQAPGEATAWGFTENVFCYDAASDKLSSIDINNTKAAGFKFYNSGWFHGSRRDFSDFSATADTFSYASGETTVGALGHFAILSSSVNESAAIVATSTGTALNVSSVRYGKLAAGHQLLGGAPQRSFGFETGDISLLRAISGTAQVQPAIAHSGSNALKVPSDGSNAVTVAAGLNLSTVHARFWLYIDAPPSGGAFVAQFADGTSPGNWISWIAIDENRKLRTAHSRAGSITVPIRTWTRIDFKLVIAAGTGIEELKIDGVVDQTAAGLTNNGYGNFEHLEVGNVAFDQPSNVNFYFDDFIIDRNPIDPSAYPSGHTIVSQLSGTLGGVGTYQLDAPVTIASPTKLLTKATSNIGRLFSAGGYFEATVSYDASQTQTSDGTNGFPSFWMQAKRGLYLQSLEAGWGAQGRFGEIDIWEGKDKTRIDDFNVFDWINHNGGTAAAGGYPNFGMSNGVQQDFGPVDTADHKFALLWVPKSKNGGTGLLKWYRDDVQVGRTVSYATGSSPSASPFNPDDVFSVLESDQFVLMLQSGGNRTGRHPYPLKIKRVNVWQ